MKYILKTDVNESGNEVLSKERRGDSFVYLAKDENGNHKEVNKDWILRNKDSILNLHVTSANSIYYPLHKGNCSACSGCSKWHICSIDMILSKDRVNVSEYKWRQWFLGSAYHFGKGRVVELPKVCAEKLADKLNYSYPEFIIRMQSDDRRLF